MSEDRHSQAEAVELITDPTEKAFREAENGIRQFKAALELISVYVHHPEKPFRLNQAMILDLHERVQIGRAHV